MMNWDEECQKIDIEEELRRLREALTPIREVWEKVHDCLNSAEYHAVEMWEAISQTMAILEEGK